MIVSTRAKICSLFIPMNASIAGYVSPECPVEAIKPDTEPGAENWLKLNADYAKTWPNITIKRDPPADLKDWEGSGGISLNISRQIQAQVTRACAQ